MGLSSEDPISRVRSIAFTSRTFPTTCKQPYVRPMKQALTIYAVGEISAHLQVPFLCSRNTQLRISLVIAC